VNAEEGAMHEEDDYVGCGGVYSYVGSGCLDAWEELVSEGLKVRIRPSYL
jgi:hypothetical protein